MWRPGDRHKRLKNTPKLLLGTGAGTALKAYSGLTLDEACRILNVKPPQNGVIDETMLMERFKKLYDVNEPGKGGSFHLQSKILRAKERIESEVREAGEKARWAEVLEKGWKPKVYKRWESRICVCFWEGE